MSKSDVIAFGIVVEAPSKAPSAWKEASLRGGSEPDRWLARNRSAVATRRLPRTPKFALSPSTSWVRHAAHDTLDAVENKLSDEVKLLAKAVFLGPGLGRIDEIRVSLESSVQHHTRVPPR